MRVCMDCTGSIDAGELVSGGMFCDLNRVFVVGFVSVAEWVSMLLRFAIYKRSSWNLVGYP